MARTYAGILGPLALVTCLVRGVLHGECVESIVFTGWLGLLAFTVVGYVIGRIAELIVDESVSAVVAAELAAEKSKAKG